MLSPSEKATVTVTNWDPALLHGEAGGVVL